MQDTSKLLCPASCVLETFFLPIDLAGAHRNHARRVEGLKAQRKIYIADAAI